MTYISRHADERLRERMGVPRKAIAKMADKAKAEGATRQRFSGTMRRYLDAQHFQAGSEMRVYAGHVFVFAGDVLVTGWPLPSWLRKYKPGAA